MFVSEQSQMDGGRKMEHRGHIGYEVRTLNNLLMRNMEAYLKQQDITVMQAWIIGCLYHHPDQDIFQRDLESEFSISRSTATNILQLMVRRGFLTREPVDYDDRLKKLCLTQKGRQVHEQLASHFPQLEQLLRRGISEEDLAVFHRVILCMKQNLEEITGLAGKEGTEFL